MKTVIIDKNQQSRELLENILKNIENIELKGSFDDFNSDINYKELNLILFDIVSKDSDEILDKIAQLKAEYKDLKFIALSYEINSVLVNQTLKKGADDFLLKPVIASILETSIKKINSNHKKTAKTFCVFSNKGGAGKTSFATNLAWEIFNKTNNRICILDLSFNSEDASEFLNIEQKFDIDHILSNLENLNEELILSLTGKYKDTKIHVLETKEDILRKSEFTPQKITKIINSLKNIFDFIIIDTSSILNEINVAVFSCADLILLLTSLNTQSIKNCQKCCELFDKIGYNDDKIKLIINRYIQNQEPDLEDIKKTLKKEIFNTIPNNYLTLIDAINLGQNVGEINPQSNIAKAYSKIAQDILNIDIDTNSKANYNHGIFNLLRRMGEE